MRMTDEESYKVGQEQCPKCASMGNDNSGDNLVIYSDGHKYCFACQHYVKGDGVSHDLQPQAPKEWTPVSGECEAIPSRAIDEKTARKYGYKTVRKNGQAFQVASVYKNRELVGQHIRGEGKKFKWIGTPRGCEMFGQHLFEHGGKRLVITEGEIDAMTVFQVNNGWPVVSLPNGVQSAERSVKDNLEFISSYKEVILMFDMDDAGQEAAKKVAEILPPGKAKIAQLPLKDANECLMKGQSKAVVSAIFQAAPFSPDEILHVSSINRDEVRVDTVCPFPWDSLTEFLIGQRGGEISLWASGTGSGKSTILREVAKHHLDEGRSVGLIMLEESPHETMDDIISLMINSPVRAVRAQKIMNDLRVKMGKPVIDASITDFSEEDYDKAYQELASTRLYIYDHLGNNAMENILARIDYMAVSLGVDVIVLDHITALATSMLNEDNNNNERLVIDNVMKHLRSLVERTGVHIDVVSQLKKTERHFEEGSRITLQDLKGSGSLGSVPNNIIALERDRQDKDPIQANTTTVRVLKNRLTGRTGVASALYYDRSIGRLKDVEFVEKDGKIESNPNPFGGI